MGVPVRVVTADMTNPKAKTLMMPKVRLNSQRWNSRLRLLHFLRGDVLGFPINFLRDLVAAKYDYSNPVDRRADRVFIHGDG